MKLRIRSNSLRYRLTKSDVSRLSENGYLEEKVDFGGQILTYALQLNDGKELTSSYENNTITLFAPHLMMKEFTDTEKVGLENNAGRLHLLIEKDFTCLDNVAEDQSDNYPNPVGGEINIELKLFFHLR